MALFLSSILAQAGQAAEGRLLLKASVRILPGDSTISFVLRPSQKINPFQISFAYGPTCVSGYIAPAVQYVGSSEWKKAEKDGFSYRTEDREVASLQFIMRSPQTFEQTCDVTVTTFALPPSEPSPIPQPQPQPLPEPDEPVPAPGVWREAGILNYPGGDFTLAGIQLTATYLAQELSVEIPENCTVTFSELGVVRSSEYVKATPSSDYPGVYRLDKISSFNQVRVSVSGPQNQECPIRLYVYDQTPRARPEKFLSREHLLPLK